MPETAVTVAVFPTFVVFVKLALRASRPDIADIQENDHRVIPSNIYQHFSGAGVVHSAFSFTLRSFPTNTQQLEKRTAVTALRCRHPSMPRKL